MVNKSISKHVGLMSAVVLSDLISKEQYFFRKGQLCEDGFFYNTADDIEKSTTLTYHQQKKCLKTLKQQGFVQTKLKGVPAKLHFKIIEYKILNFLNTGIQKIDEQVVEDFNTNKNKPNNNKLNKNKGTVSTSLFEDSEIENVPCEVLKYLNKQKPSNRDFDLTASNLTEIKARIKEKKYSMEDFKNVIDFKIKEWKDDAKMKMYIRPSTLFGKKFNEYLIQVENKGIKNDGSDNFVFNPSEKADLK